MPSQGETVEIKSVNGLVVKDEEKGEIEAVVATFGVVDRDGDVILDGAIPAGTKAKISSYGHSLVFKNEAPVGKGTISPENGKAVFRGRYFMTTPEGRNAFNTVKELAEDTEWSFGFNQVKQGTMSREWKVSGARRVIEKMNAFEVSPVYLGSGIGTGTLTVKHSKQAAEEAAAEAELEERRPMDAAVKAKEEADKVEAERLAAEKQAAEEAEAKRLAEEAEAKQKAEIEEGIKLLERNKRLDAQL